MRNNRRIGRDELRSIAREATLQRGLLPAFSAQTLAETDKIATAPTGAGPKP